MASFQLERLFMANTSIIKRTIYDYQRIVGTSVIQTVTKEAGTLADKRVLMINSTPSGGGVAEILNSLVLLLNSLGLKTDWRIIKGSDSFFSITKSFHNAFQGDTIRLTKAVRELYEQINYNNAAMTHLGHYDAVVIHDPQPLAMINFKDKHAPWIWRFHPDMTKPNPILLKYLKRFIGQYDGMIISTPQYRKSLLKIPQHIIAPSIDPLTDKNRPLDNKTIQSLFKAHAIKTDKPIIAQVSRFDKWKDPLGVIKVFKQVRRKINCRLVLIGNLASDDPEGPEIFKQVMKQANSEVDVLVNCNDNDLLVNALQTKARVVLQKSIREGFALTVSEALWKGTPVVGANVGGIPLQVINGKTGYLVSSQKQAADACIRLLKNNTLRKKLGTQGKEHVRKNFLITRHLHDYLKLFNHYLGT